MASECVAVPGLGEVLARLAVVEGGGCTCDGSLGGGNGTQAVAGWEFVVPEGRRVGEADGCDKIEGGEGTCERVKVSTGEGLTYRYVQRHPFGKGCDGGENSLVVARAVLNRPLLSDLPFAERERKVAEMEREAIQEQLADKAAPSVEDIGRLLEADPIVDRHARVALPTAFRELIAPALRAHLEPSGVDEGKLGRDVEVDWTPECHSKGSFELLGASCRTSHTAPDWPAPGPEEPPEEPKACLRRRAQRRCREAVRHAVDSWAQVPPLSLLNRDAVKSATDALRLAKTEGRSEQEDTNENASEQKVLAVLNSTQHAREGSGEHKGDTPVSAFESAAIDALAKFAVLFHKVAVDNITHPELHVCLCNRAAVYGALGLHEEALVDALEAERRAVSKRTSRIHVRKGHALLGLLQYRAAGHAFDDALRLAPDSNAPKRGLEKSQRGLILALANGRAQHRLITLRDNAQETSRAITELPASAHKERLPLTDPLPTALLAPRAAENDDNVHDAYNYLQTLCDTRLPQRYVLGYMEDTRRLQAFTSAIRSAIHGHPEERHLRVLHLGAGGGLLSLVARDAGARHVTCAGRWQYLAQACAHVLTANGGSDDTFKVVCRRLHELTLSDSCVPHPCHVAILDDVFDDGLLSAGYLLALTNAHRRGLLHPKATIVPRAAHVWCQPVQVKTRPFGMEDHGRISLEAMDTHRWMPMHSHGLDPSAGAVIVLGPPVPVFDFVSSCPPDAAEEMPLEFTVERTGALNAVRFWYALDLGNNETLHTGPDSPITSLRPAIQYLPGEMRVRKGATVPMVARHNTQQLRFEAADECDFAELSQQDASFPHASAFAQLSDRRRLAGYAGALKNAVGNLLTQSLPSPSPRPLKQTREPAWKRRMRLDGSKSKMRVRVLDVGTGSGVLAMLSARFGATDVVAVELREALVLAARRNVARNGLNDRVTVVHSDVRKVVRGREGLWRHPADIVVMDVFDTALLGGDPSTFLHDLRDKGVVNEVTQIVPRAASLWAVGVECLTSDETGSGYDVSALDAFRDTGGAEPIYLQRHAHRVLTMPVRLCTQRFDHDGDHGLGKSTTCTFPVTAAGRLNAICYWYDLHLDEDITLSNSPSDKENRVTPHYWGQALRQLPAAAEVSRGGSVSIEVLRQDVRRPFEFRVSQTQSLGPHIRLVPHPPPPWLVPDTAASHRVHICDLLFASFAQRVAYRARGEARFTEDASMRRFTTHCGSLSLCPRVIVESLFELASHERVQNERKVDASAIFSEELTAGGALALC